MNILGLIDRALILDRIPDLNVVFYDESFFMPSTSALGTPIRERGEFTRICIEEDLDKPVVGKVWIQDHWHKVEYEGLHTIYLQFMWVLRSC
jgi:hypothetical protein